MDLMISDIEQKIEKESMQLFWFRFYQRYDHTYKCRRFTQLMLSINQKNDCDGLLGCYGMELNKRVMKRAILLRLK